MCGRLTGCQNFWKCVKCVKF
uniref:Uncharacterized protein n=1 Tax=Anguilla anguilla TaxID=7936 RepID=A0A0E9VH53_ANGAN